MRIGSLVKWTHFPEPQFGGDKKPRWFICLGQTDFSIDPKNFYFHSTTRQENGQGRKFCFLKHNYPKFTYDCFLYYNEPPYSRSEYFISQHVGNIEELCSISNEDIKIIYEGIRRYSISYSRKILLDIHNSLNLIGITGLHKP
jgi:hypothetical protein